MFTSRTPGTLRKAFSTRPTQLAQLIPEISNLLSRTSTPYPAPLTVSIKPAIPVASGSYSTVALPFARFTFTPETPSVFERDLSTRLVHAAHVIPTWGWLSFVLLRSLRSSCPLRFHSHPHFTITPTLFNNLLLLRVSFAPSSEPRVWKRYKPFKGVVYYETVASFARYLLRGHYHERRQGESRQPSS